MTRPPLAYAFRTGRGRQVARPRPVRRPGRLPAWWPGSPPARAAGWWWALLAASATLAELLLLLSSWFDFLFCGAAPTAEDLLRCLIAGPDEHPPPTPRRGAQ